MTDLTQDQWRTLSNEMGAWLQQFKCDNRSKCNYSGEKIEAAHVSGAIYDNGSFLVNNKETMSAIAQVPLCPECHQGDVGLDVVGEEIAFAHKPEGWLAGRAMYWAIRFLLERDDVSGQEGN